MMLVSSRVENLFRVEIANDPNFIPSLITVIDSVQQAPADVLEDWCKANVDGLEDELWWLVDLHGDAAKLIEPCGSYTFRRISALEQLAKVTR